jgi:hypothetical protein
MREFLIELKLPYQKPQIINVRMMANGIYRMAVLDRFDRVETLSGEEIGFGIIMFQTFKFPRIIRLVVRENWSEALYRNWEGQAVLVDIHKYDD